MSRNKITRIGVDIAKSVFHVHAVDRHGHTVDRAGPEAEIGMEACATSHHWARVFSARGYRVRLIAAQFVKPYVKSNKNDWVDAEAICEAMSRPGMRFVSTKSIEQQDIQAMHRIREELLKQRTAKANQIRGLAGEYGLIAPVGIHQLRRALPIWLEDADNGLTMNFRALLSELTEDLRHLNQRIESLDKRIADYVKNDARCQRLLKLRGVGPIIASALICHLGDGSGFRKGREFAASIGLTPRQHSTGGKERLLGISKRGDGYLRRLLVHGARAMLHHSHNRDDALSLWLKELSTRKHANVVVVAMANKTARMAWALITHETEYDPEYTCI